jgi:predicted kinase
VTGADVLVLSGPPCSGKSSVGRLLSSEACHIEVDALFSFLLPESDRNRQDRLLAYDAAHSLARLLVERGRTVILECTYARREQRASLVEALAGLPEVPLWVVEFVISPDDAVARFRERDQATDLDEGMVRERAEGFPYSDQGLLLKSSASTPEVLAQEVTEWLRHQPQPVQRVAWAEAGRAWD